MYMRGRAHRAVAAAMVIVPILSGCSLGQDKTGCGRDSDGVSGCSVSGEDGRSSAASTDGGGTDDARLAHDASPTAAAASPSRSSAPPMKDGTAVLTRCATMDDPFVTLQVHNPNARDGVFSVTVGLQDSAGRTVAEAGAQEPVAAKDTATVRLGVAGTGHVDKTTHCTVEPRATFDW